jgi:septum formation protein
MTTTLWLASGSPRRRDLLGWAGIPLEVRPTHADETRRDGVEPIAHARELAERKARAAIAPSDRVVLGADTVVHRGDAIYEKPLDRADAVAMLATLSGDVHAVTTGVCVRRGERLVTLHRTTMVRFRVLSTDEIEAYVATGEADDKAGAYGIQGRAGSFVAALEGDYTNVVGLPLEATLEALASFAILPARRTQ